MIFNELGCFYSFLNDYTRLKTFTNVSKRIKNVSDDNSAAILPR